MDHGSNIPICFDCVVYCRDYQMIDFNSLIELESANAVLLENYCRENGFDLVESYRDLAIAIFNSKNRERQDTLNQLQSWISHQRSYVTEPQIREALLAMQERVNEMKKAPEANQ
jgi:hypothetical protein